MASGYNVMRDDVALLEENERSPPSFSVHLYPDHWTLNTGPKFSYNNPISTLLDDIRALRIPTDFIKIFDDAGISFYNGCLIVEILDFRPARVKEPVLEKPDKQRVVLRPNGETIWADICIMNAKFGSKWTDMDALEVESKLLLSTSNPLCLSPDPSLMRTVNSILRVSTPSIPNSLKRKAAPMVDLEEDETEKAKRAKIMQFMNPQFSPSRKPFVPNYKILNTIEQHRATKSQTSQRPSNGADPGNQATVIPPHVQQVPDKASSCSISTVVPHLTTAYSQPNTIPHQPAPITALQTQAPPQLQQVIDPSQRATPSKQQQASNAAAPQRPPSRPATGPQMNNSNQQAQIQEQQTTQPTAFNPPLPPPDYLNPPPASRRRPSLAINPSTPAGQSISLPAQQAVNQIQSSQTQAQPQQQRPTSSQAPSQPQRIPLQAQTQPTRSAQMPPNMSLQAMQQHVRNMQFQHPNAPAVPMTQTAATIAAMQRQNLNGRNTPISRANSNASPAPSSTAAAQSPMLPAAAATMSRQNTPVATNTQVARGSPLAGNHPVAARAVMAQSGPQQQQPQQPMPGTQPVIMQPGAAMNPALYQHYQQQRLQAYFAQQARQQAQAQMHQQGRLASATPQPQTNQQSGIAQPQQTNQEQNAGTQQPFSVQIPPQAFNYMQMHPQQYLWTQRAMGRGMPQVPPSGQQQIPGMPPGMSLQQMQGLGRGGGLPQNR
ncbi:SPT20 [Sanghuangporus weigelae]